MQKLSGSTYKSSVWGKATCVSEAKVGKSCYLVGGALGVLPWSKFGIVDAPENLIVFTFDAGALDGIRAFLTSTCKAPAEALNFTVYNLEDDVRKVCMNDVDYDFSFYNTVQAAIYDARQSIKGTTVALFSSLTGAAKGIERGVVGPPKKNYSDPSKWKSVQHQLHELQNYAQADGWHVLWEGHIDKPPPPPMDNKDAAPAKETIQVPGEAGRSWTFNTPQVFRIRRDFGKKYQTTKCDSVYLDTAPALSFIANGRGYNEKLDAKEPCPAQAFEKLGLQIGGWNKK